MREHEDAELDALLEGSSLDTPAARQLRQRTTLAQAELARRLAGATDAAQESTLPLPERPEEVAQPRVRSTTTDVYKNVAGRAPGSRAATLEIVELDLHAAAAKGRLAQYMIDSPAAGKAVLYRLVSELVYERITWPVERARGHRGCTVSADRLLPDCHDRHQDDVEAVLAHVMRHADQPIANLRGWLVPRLRPVTVNANRVRRGASGALQRPHLPHWLDTALGGDRWLTELALEILTGVGVPTAAADGIWPLSAWAERRGRATGEYGCTEADVASDVERVLAVMRTHPTWYEKYVERPLGHKQVPLTSQPQGDAEEAREPSPLLLTAPDEDDLGSAPFNPPVLLPSPQTGTVAEFLDWLEKVKDRSGMSFRALARITGMPRSAIASQFRRRTLPSWDIVATIVAACGITDAEDLRMCSRVWAAVRDAETARRGGAPALRSSGGAARMG